MFLSTTKPTNMFFVDVIVIIFVFLSLDWKIRAYEMRSCKNYQSTCSKRKYKYALALNNFGGEVETGLGCEQRDIA